MSVEAITLAAKARIGRSTTKFVFVMLANCANERFLAFPSVNYLADVTAQDRKTVLKAIHWLRDNGWLVDTGRRAGDTGRVPVYRLCFDVTIGKNAAEDVGEEAGNGAENGTAEQSQKRDCPNGETVPIFPRNGTNFPSKQSQKRDSEPSGTVRKQERGGRAPSPNRTFSDWLESLEGDDPIPADDPIFDKAKRMGLPEEYVELAWLAFCDRYREDSERKYRDWRIVFRRAFRENWFKLWWLESGGEFKLSPVGQQYRNARAGQ
jgi:biotin operon repressor